MSDSEPITVVADPAADVSEEQSVQVVEKPQSVAGEAPSPLESAADAPTPVELCVTEAAPAPVLPASSAADAAESSVVSSNDSDGAGAAVDPSSPTGPIVASNPAAAATAVPAMASWADMGESSYVTPASPAPAPAPGPAEPSLIAAIPFKALAATLADEVKQGRIDALVSTGPERAALLVQAFAAQVRAQCCLVVDAPYLAHFSVFGCDIQFAL